MRTTTSNNNMANFHFIEPFALLLSHTTASLNNFFFLFQSKWRICFSAVVCFWVLNIIHLFFSEIFPYFLHMSYQKWGQWRNGGRQSLTFLCWIYNNSVKIPHTLDWKLCYFIFLCFYRLSWLFSFFIWNTKIEKSLTWRFSFLFFSVNSFFLREDLHNFYVVNFYAVLCEKNIYLTMLSFFNFDPFGNWKREEQEKKGFVKIWFADCTER